MTTLAPALESVGLSAETKFLSFRRVGPVLAALGLAGRAPVSKAAGDQLVARGELHAVPKLGSRRRVVAVAELERFVRNVLPSLRKGDDLLDAASSYHAAPALETIQESAP